MRQPTLVRAVERLAEAGEQAGFSVEGVIRMLNAGLTVATLLDIIDRSIQASPLETARSSRWIMYWLPTGAQETDERETQCSEANWEKP
jgi:hypothetical protein